MHTTVAGGAADGCIGVIHRGPGCEQEGQTTYILPHPRATYQTEQVCKASSEWMHACVDNDNMHLATTAGCGGSTGCSATYAEEKKHRLSRLWSNKTLLY